MSEEDFQLPPIVSLEQLQGNEDEQQQQQQQQQQQLVVPSEIPDQKRPDTAIFKRPSSVYRPANNHHPPPPPYRVHLLHGAQSHYECYSACSFVAILFVWYLVQSKWRELSCINWWLKIGCWIYKLNERTIPKLQTLNKHLSDKTYITPKTARTLIETTHQGLMYIEELAGIISNPTENSGNHIDKQYLEENAFIPLWKTIRRMFFLALSQPIGATFVSSTNYIHTLGIRWNADIPLETVQAMKFQICPEGADHYDKLDEPTLEELDEAVNISKFFLLDFLDSHLNKPVDGMPGGDPETGSGVWIQFSNLTQIRDYLQERYPVKEDTSENVDIFLGRKNSFDLVLWKSDPFPQEQSDIDFVLSNYAFQEWHRLFDESIQRTRNRNMNRQKMK